MTTCRRTESILERLLDDLPLSSADVAHLRTCGVCGPASGRMPAFGGALRLAARAVAGEPIPAAVLSPEALVPVRAVPSRLLLGAAGLAVVVAAGLAMAVLRPGQGPDVGVLPLPQIFTAEREVVAGLQSAGFACSDLAAEPKATPVVDGTMCHPDGLAGPLLSVIVLERDANGDVRELIAKASPDDRTNPDDARAVVGILTTAVHAGLADASSRAEIEAWISDNAGRLSPGESGLRLFGRLIVALERFDDEGLGLHITVAAEP